MLNEKKKKKGFPRHLLKMAERQVWCYVTSRKPSWPIIAKQLLLGWKVVVVHCKGNECFWQFLQKKLKYLAFLSKWMIPTCPVAATTSLGEQ